MFRLLFGFVIVDVLYILRVLIFLVDRFFRLYEWVKLVFGIWWLFSVIRLNLGLKLCMVIWLFLLLLWLMVIFGICISDLVRLEFGNLFIFFVEIVFIIFGVLCFRFMVCNKLLWIFCILMILICGFVVLFVFWVRIGWLVVFISNVIDIVRWFLLNVV